MMGERINVNKAIARRRSEDLWGDNLPRPTRSSHRTMCGTTPVIRFRPAAQTMSSSIVTMLWTMVPDLRVDVGMQIAEGDLVVNRFVTGLRCRGYCIGFSLFLLSSVPLDLLTSIGDSPSREHSLA